ncbi:MAG TPA: sigma-70 family RNA polymerase sigma factor [Polyangiaceae bacterium]|nr:sigma-70 family RNA polymerase sigma factor [Polyangiaceae bacterium]
MVVRASQPALTVSRAGPSDAALVLSARAGERWAQEALFRRHAMMANNLAHRLLLSDSDLDDLVQDSFIAAFESLDRLVDPQAFASWLCSIIVRTAHKRLRRKRLLERLGLLRPSPVDLDVLATRSTPPDVATELRKLYAVVQRLPAEERVVLLLRRVEGLTVGEIAEQLGRSPATVKRRLERAHAKLERDGGKS